MSNRSEEMEALLKQYESSEQTVARFCADHAVKVATFYYWRKKLRAVAAAEPTQSGFVAIRSQLRIPAALTPPFRKVLTPHSGVLTPPGCGKPLTFNCKRS